ncbi:MAG TPA: SAM-dependent methyltransferase [Myxococcota bacterium]|nr:SAM-dependent methyltransferase [Myxococcota bacterium]
MHDERPSLTAILVGVLRGVAPSPIEPARVVDPWAHRALPAPAGALTRALAPLMRIAPIEAAWRLGWAGLSSHIVLRTLAIDDAVRDALSAGCGQVIVLGAGFDARAARMPELAQIPVLEVDHPATQAAKRGRLPESHARYVAVDFTRDDLAERLTASGLLPGVPAAVVWEGVTPYLPPDVTGATLAVLGRVLPPGSMVITSFCLPELMSVLRRHGWLAHLLFRWIGEPLAGVISEDDVQELARRAGLSPLRTSGARDWARRYGREEPLNIIEERVLVARREPLPAP